MKNLTTYVSWTCASNKKQLCVHIEPKWDIVKKNIMEEDRKINEKKDEQDVPLVTLQYFRKEKTGKINKKTEKEIIVLKAIKMKHDIVFILNSISELLPDIIYHRNHLCHYRNCLQQVLNFHDRCALLDADFAENLTVPVKYEPQSLHWCHQQVSIHSGITKFSGEKNYHAYFSDNRTCGFH